VKPATRGRHHRGGTVESLAGGNPALHTRDLGGKATTAEVTQAVCRQLADSLQSETA
jgi:hypothetical protein